MCDRKCIDKCTEWIERIFRHMYSTFRQKKNDLVIQTGWNVFVQSPGCCTTEQPKTVESTLSDGVSEFRFNVPPSRRSYGDGTSV